MRVQPVSNYNKKSRLKDSVRFKKDHKKLKARQLREREQVCVCVCSAL